MLRDGNAMRELFANEAAHALFMARIKGLGL